MRQRLARRYGGPLALLVVGACLSWAGVGIPGLPKLTDLGTLGGKVAGARAINDAGQICGWAQTHAGEWHAFLWEKGRMHDLGTLGGTESWAAALNSRGQVVGYARTTAGDDRAFLWQCGRMRDLGTLPGCAVSRACAIDNRGQVVGQAERVGYGNTHAFLWQKGRMADLRLSGRSRGWVLEDATGINDRGWVVGEARRLPVGERVAYLWRQGRLRNVGQSVGRWSQAINAKGDVAVCDGWATGCRSLLWTRGRLGPLGGSSHPHASVTVSALSDRQVAVGCEMLGSSEALLLRPGRTLYLDRVRRNGPRMRLAEANGINNRGDIVGCGWVGDKQRAFQLTGVPGADGR